MSAAAFYTPNRQKLYLLGGGQVDAVKVGARIKAARKVRRLTQAELAQEVDITPKYLSNIECGAKSPPQSSAQRSPSSLPRYLPMSEKGLSGSSML